MSSINDNINSNKDKVKIKQPPPVNHRALGAALRASIVEVPV